VDVDMIIGTDGYIARIVVHRVASRSITSGAKEEDCREEAQGYQEMVGWYMAESQGMAATISWIVWNKRWRRRLAKARMRYGTPFNTTAAYIYTKLHIFSFDRYLGHHAIITFSPRSAHIPPPPTTDS
jgi:hypothetical protein